MNRWENTYVSGVQYSTLNFQYGMYRHIKYGCMNFLSRSAADKKK